MICVVKYFYKEWEIDLQIRSGFTNVFCCKRIPRTLFSPAGQEHRCLQEQADRHHGTAGAL